MVMQTSANNKLKKLFASEKSSLETNNNNKK